MFTRVLHRRGFSRGQSFMRARVTPVLETMEARRLLSVTVSLDASHDPASSWHFTDAVHDDEGHMLMVEQSTSGDEGSFSAFSQPGDGFWNDAGDGTLDLVGVPGRTLYYRVSGDGGATWGQTIQVHDDVLIAPQNVTVGTGGYASVLAAWDADPYQPYGANEGYDVTFSNGGTPVQTVNGADVTGGIGGQQLCTVVNVAYPGDWTVSVRRTATDPFSFAPIEPSGWSDSSGPAAHVYAPTPYGMSASNGDDFSPDAPKVSLSCYVDQAFAGEVVAFYNADTGAQVGEGEVHDGYASAVVEHQTGGRTYHYFARAFAPDVNGDMVACDGHSEIVTDVQNHTWWAGWANGGGAFANVAEADVTGQLVTKVDGVATRMGFSAAVDNFTWPGSAMYFSDGRSAFGDTSATGFAGLKVASPGFELGSQYGTITVTHTSADGSTDSASLDWAWMAH